MFYHAILLYAYTTVTNYHCIAIPYVLYCSNYHLSVVSPSCHFFIDMCCCHIMMLCCLLLLYFNVLKVALRYIYIYAHSYHMILLSTYCNLYHCYHWCMCLRVTCTLLWFNATLPILHMLLNYCFYYI